MLGIPLGLLIDERQLLDVRERLHILRPHTRLIEGALVVDRVLVGIGEHGLEAIQLHLLQL